MYLLYLDDSGSIANKNEEYIVLAGVSVYEAQVDYLIRELDKLAQSIDSHNPDQIEFHASEIYSRKVHPWNKMQPAEARNVIKAVLQVLASSYDSAVVLGCAIHKDSYPGEDHLENAFEDLCKRFDTFLATQKPEGNRERGLLILDEHSKETNLRDLAINFKKLGTKWGNIRNVADIPYFANSKAFRLIQLADHVAYSIFRRYNASDTQYFDIISSKIYTNNNVVHGLAHKQKKTFACMCPACLSRRISKDIYSY